jgi:hypothetical protein
MSLEDKLDSYAVAFSLAALVGLIWMASLSDSGDKALNDMKQPLPEMTEFVFREQWRYLDDRIHKDVEDKRISPEMFNKVTSFLRVLINSPHQKPPSDYTITDSGAVVFNWNKVIYHRIEND